MRCRRQPAHFVSSGSPSRRPSHHRRSGSLAGAPGILIQARETTEATKLKGVHHESKGEASGAQDDAGDAGTHEITGLEGQLFKAVGRLQVVGRDQMRRHSARCRVEETACQSQECRQRPDEPERRSGEDRHGGQYARDDQPRGVRAEHQRARPIAIGEHAADEGEDAEGYRGESEDQ